MTPTTPTGGEGEGPFSHVAVDFRTRRLMFNGDPRHLLGIDEAASLVPMLNSAYRLGADHARAAAAAELAAMREQLREALEKLEDIAIVGGP